MALLAFAAFPSSWSVRDLPEEGSVRFYASVGEAVCWRFRDQSREHFGCSVTSCQLVVSVCCEGWLHFKLEIGLKLRLGHKLSDGPLPDMKMSERRSYDEELLALMRQRGFRILEAKVNSIQAAWTSDFLNKVQGHSFTISTWRLASPGSMEPTVSCRTWACQMNVSVSALAGVVAP